MKKSSYYFINGITLYRLLAAPFLVYLIFNNRTDLFKWLLAFSFFTDLIDGYLARRYKVTSILGSRLDSIADDLTIVASIMGTFILKSEFIGEESVIIYTLLVLFVIQNIFALFRYRKMTSFHTYLAKASALLQGIFFILLFFLPRPVYELFYVAAVITGLELVEEILMVLYLPVWRANIKGLFWLLKEKHNNG
jgi:phosphatidylglycerophosphate synthase